MHSTLVRNPTRHHISTNDGIARISERHVHSPATPYSLGDQPTHSKKTAVGTTLVVHGRGPPNKTMSSSIASARARPYYKHRAA